MGMLAVAPKNAFEGCDRPLRTPRPATVPDGDPMERLARRAYRRPTVLF
jgi:hypothetical protein